MRLKIYVCAFHATGHIAKLIVYEVMKRMYVDVIKGKMGRKHEKAKE